MSIWHILIAITAISVGVFHFRRLSKFHALYRQYRFRLTEPHIKQSFQEFLEFSKDYYEYAPALEEKAKSIRDPFLREAIGAFLHGGLTGYDLLRTLRQKADQGFESEMALLHDLNFTTRAMPAVGWAVAISSTIWMFKGGSEPVSFERAAMAFSMTMAAILYGLFVTYVFVTPLMERVWRNARDARAKNCALVEALGLLMRKKSAFELYETVQILLPQEVRPEWSDVFVKRLNKAG